MQPARMMGIMRVNQRVSARRADTIASKAGLEAATPSRVAFGKAIDEKRLMNE